MKSIPDRHAVVIGDALIDELIGELNITTRVPGGSALNVAVGLSILGIGSTIIASVAADSDSRILEAHTNAFGVRHIWSTNTLGTGIARSDRTNGEPRYSFNPAAQARTISYTPEALARIAAADIVIISGFPFDSATECDALHAALTHRTGLLAIDPNPRAGMLTDAERFVAGLERIAHGADLVKIGDEDAELLYGETLLTAAHRLLTSGAHRVLATAGANGASLITGRAELLHDIAPDTRPIVDTMGAGDATLAVVTAGLVNSTEPTIPEWDAILGRAMATAAETIRHAGALLRLPRWPESNT